GEHGAGLHRLPVEQDGARPARAGVAAHVGRREVEDVAQVVHEERPVLHLGGGLLAVDGDRQLHCAALFSLPRASLIAFHTRSGVAGISMWRTPRWDRASTTAFCTAGVAPIVPASPMPLTPSGLTSVGVSMVSSSKLGSSAAEIMG